MAKGVALHIGVNRVDPAHYAGWDGKLNACEADAEDTAELARAQGFETDVLLTAEACREPVLRWMLGAAETLTAGDIFLIFYSGHGGQLPDLDGDENDDADETWCLFDGQISDDELHAVYRRFAPGVRGLVLSDSCHSGTVTKTLMVKANLEQSGLGRIGPESTFKAMPPDVADKTWRRNRSFYEPILTNPGLKGVNDGEPSATVRLISGCQDNQFSRDGTFNSAFTAALLRVWNKSNFKGGYHHLHKQIQAQLPDSQSPNHYVIGPPDPEYDAQRPFTINGSKAMSTEQSTKPIEIAMTLNGVKPTDESAVAEAVKGAATKMARDLSEAASRKDQSVSVTGSTNSQGHSSVSATYTIKW